jgi:WhiB family redox-sensing transcriptional regulator
VIKVKEFWRQAAACRYADPDLFVPVSSSGKGIEQVAEAKAFCERCLVHSASGVRGVGPAERTGKPSVTYCPGGTRSAAPSGTVRRRRNPRKIGGLISSHSSLVPTSTVWLRCKAANAIRPRLGRVVDHVHYRFFCGRRAAVAPDVKGDQLIFKGK